MPIYEFKCDDCGARYEELVRMSQNTPPPCPKCKSENTRRQLSAVAAQIPGGKSLGGGCSPRGGFS